MPAVMEPPTAVDPKAAAKKAAKAAANARYRAKVKAAKAEPAPAPAPVPTPEPAAPAGSITERAMLVNLSIGYWDGKKRDKNKTAEIVKDEKADADAGIWWTQVIPKSAMKPVILARDNARIIHLRYTLPWLDRGIRVLPAAMFQKYTKELREAHDAYRAAVAKFVAEYPTYVADARKRLGGLFRDDFIPDAAEIAGKFPWSIHYAPIPTKNDFRVNLGADEVANIRKQIEDDARAAMVDAMGDVWERLHEVVSKLAERLGDADATFRDSLIGNALELCDLLPKLNVTGDRDLENARAALVARFAKADPEQLRKDKPARADAAKAANDILKKMEAFMPKKK